MQVSVTRIDRELPLPRYETAGAVAFDIFCRVDTVVAPKAIALIPGNVIVKVPPGHVLLLASRSSTPVKKGLLTPHGIGIIDHDFCGPNDELRVQLYNFTDAPVTVSRGERLAQVLVVPFERAEIVETAVEVAVSRGGFGSTGA